MMTPAEALEKIREEAEMHWQVYDPPAWEKSVHRSRLVLAEALADAAKRYHDQIGYQRIGAQDPHYGDWDTCNSLLCRYAQSDLVRAAGGETR